MLSIIHFRRDLGRSPDAVAVPAISVRSMLVPDDISSWLALRERTMAEQSPQVRRWSPADFYSEMQSKTWWRPDRTWLAVAGDTRFRDRANSSSLVGSVTLALREGASAVVPVVHWLLVDPAWRRCGIGRLLLSKLEQAVWERGWRRIELETHAGWTEAVAFYHSMGYAPVRERSPR